MRTAIGLATDTGLDAGLDAGLALASSVGSMSMIDGSSIPISVVCCATLARLTSGYTNAQRSQPF